jgi:hypothetical protein
MHYESVDKQEKAFSMSEKSSCCEFVGKGICNEIYLKVRYIIQILSLFLQKNILLEHQKLFFTYIVPCPKVEAPHQLFGPRFAML